jgi:hypothetical protein
MQSRFQGFFAISSQILSLLFNTFFLSKISSLVAAIIALHSVLFGTTAVIIIIIIIKFANN